MNVYVLTFNKFRGVRAFRIFLKKVLTNARMNGIMCLWLAMANYLKQIKMPKSVS